MWWNALLVAAGARTLPDKNELANACPFEEASLEERKMILHKGMVSYQSYILK